MKTSRLMLLSLILALSSGATDADDLLLSGRMEMIYFANFTGSIREDSKEKTRFYFNNIFLNLEGDLGERANFIVEFQPLTSDLYLLGGYLTIAEALEGIGTDEPLNGRKAEIRQLVSHSIDELDRASDRLGFERAAITFFPRAGLGISLGRVRNPFGFWDDYSLFRNLSALKTDPVTLGVSLRRTDMGALVFGTTGPINWQAGVLAGENTLTNRDLDNGKDMVFKLGWSPGPVDVAASLYYHNIAGSSPTRARGLSYRYRASYNLSLLGEFIKMDNDRIDVESQGMYIQANYDLSDRIADGLRWNMFFETYDSDLLAVDIEPGLDYRFKGTYFQASTGFVYAYNRNIDLGAKMLTGADEEGDFFHKAAVKIDARF